MKAKSQVTTYPAADSAKALEHFTARLGFETDCWDVNHSFENKVANFVLLDVRSKECFEKGHIPNAIHLPTLQIDADTLPCLPDNGIYVVYCAGPHCNGANKAAIRIATIGLPVKEMIGGAIGWVDEGFQLVSY